MNSLILFLNAFLSYFLLFALIVILVIVAVVAGIKLRQAKDAKLETAKSESATEEINATE